MDTKGQKTEAIVLRGRNYEDNHRILVALTKEFGKLPLMARNAKKPTGSLRAVSQTFTQSNIVFSKGKGGMGILSQGEVVNAFGGIKESLEKIAYASYIAEMIDYAIPDGRRYDSVYQLVISCFLLMEALDDCEIIARYFEMQLMNILGYRPYLQDCPVCGRTLQGGQFVWVPSRGGIMCSSCAGPYEGNPISAGTIMTMNKLIEGDLRQLMKLKITGTVKEELERAIFNYCDYYIERAPRARAALQTYL